MSDYWWDQRYDDLLFDEHERNHPNSDPNNCPWCGISTEGDAK